MAGKNPQTFAKRAREQAVREKREAKRAKKAEATAAERAAERAGQFESDDDTPERADA
jgi:hypothetical protein